MTQEIIISKGKAALEAEAAKQELQEVRKAAIAEYLQGKSPIDILRNPAVTYTYDGKEYAAILEASDLLDSKQKLAIYGNRSAKAAYNRALSRLADCVAADAAQTLGKNAPRIARTDGLGVLKHLASYLGYEDYAADKRDFDYIAMGMTGINKEADIQVKAAKKAVSSLFRVKLNGGNVRVMMRGGVEFSLEYMNTKAQKEREEAARQAEKEKIAREKAEAKAAKEKAAELAKKKTEATQENVDMKQVMDKIEEAQKEAMEAKEQKRKEAMEAKEQKEATQKKDDKASTAA